MAQHEAPVEAQKQAAIIRANLKDHFTFHYTTDRYNGQYAGKFSVREFAEELDIFLCVPCGKKI